MNQENAWTFLFVSNCSTLPSYPRWSLGSPTFAQRWQSHVRLWRRLSVEHSILFWVRNLQRVSRFVICHRGTGQDVFFVWKFFQEFIYELRTRLWFVSAFVFAFFFSAFLFGFWMKLSFSIEDCMIRVGGAWVFFTSSLLTGCLTP